MVEQQSRFNKDSINNPISLKCQLVEGIFLKADRAEGQKSQDISAAESGRLGNDTFVTAKGKSKVVELPVGVAEDNGGPHRNGHARRTADMRLCL